LQGRGRKGKREKFKSLTTTSGKREGSLRGKEGGRGFHPYSARGILNHELVRKRVGKGRGEGVPYSRTLILV